MALQSSGCSSLGCNGDRQPPAATLSYPVFEDLRWRSGLRSGEQLSNADRALLEAELEALRAAADAHTQALQKLKKQIDRRSYLLSPIRRLPDEVMEAILVLLWKSYGVSQADGIPLKATGTADSLPILLPSRRFAPPHVCSWWRRLTLQGLALRPHFVINIPKMMHIKSAPAGGLPKEIRLSLTQIPYPYIRVHLIGPDSERAFPSSITDECTMQFGRWQYACLEHLPWQNLISVTRADLPRLEHAEIILGLYGWQNVWEGPGDGYRIKIFDTARQLRSVTLQNDFVVTSRLPFTLPWSQLRRVVVKKCSLGVSLEILSECKSLQSFDYNDEREEEEIVREDDDIPPSWRVTTSVEDFAWKTQGLSSIGMRSLVERTTMPFLRRLETWRLPPALLSLVEAPQHLTTLHLTASICWVSGAEVFNILRSLPGLVSLSFEYITRVEDECRPYREGETMNDVLHQLSAGVRFLRELQRFSFRCKELCNSDCIHDFLARQAGRPRYPSTPGVLREVRVETPLTGNTVNLYSALAEGGGVEIYGLDRCAEMYKAL
ncbi:uncharacterized protein SCHCODRAFT_01217132 [Schizophyllum commune H4-8]|nr:uncharacterized protein SCHCODRAFT_01217132 [Schizophyllum commune H4-8]KAI5898687.1 hypothetical protein SCHCODRAFT_01217132 [Schizophyllum commune H4-8]